MLTDTSAPPPTATTATRSVRGTAKSTTEQDIVILRWIKEQWGKGEYIRPKDIMNHSAELHNRGSAGWWEKFKNRNDILLDERTFKNYDLL